MLVSLLSWPCNTPTKILLAPHAQLALLQASKETSSQKVKKDKLLLLFSMRAEQVPQPEVMFP